MKRIFCVFALILSACSPHSLENYQFEGEALCRAIVRELEKVHTREELAAALPRLKKQFAQLTDLMIEAKTFQLKHSEEMGIDPAYYEHPYAEALKDELVRVCNLEGGREMIEKAQREALIRLDAFEHSLKKN